MAFKRLTHPEHATKDDATLAAEAKKFFNGQSSVQFVAFMLTLLRDKNPTWWQPKALREFYSETQRLRDLTSRVDIRSRIAKVLTNMPEQAARKVSPDFLASYIETVLEADKTDVDFENAFAPEELALYGDAPAYFFRFMDVFPWDQNTDQNREIVNALIQDLLNSRATPENKLAKPILSEWDVLNAIPGIIVMDRLPLKQRAIIFDAIIAQEKGTPREVFHAKQILAAVPLEMFVKYVHLDELREVFVVATKALGFERPVVEKPAETPPATPAEPEKAPETSGVKASEPSTPDEGWTRLDTNRAASQPEIVLSNPQADSSDGPAVTVSVNEIDLPDLGLEPVIPELKPSLPRPVAETKTLDALKTQLVEGNLLAPTNNLLDGTWPALEENARAAMWLILRALNPEQFAKDDEWTEYDFRTQCDALFTELDRHGGELRSLSRKLRSSRPGHRPPPLPPKFPTK